MTRIAVIGEGMLELTISEQILGPARVAYGGDALNTATYLARTLPHGARVSFFSRMGDDPFSSAILRAAESEGIDCRGVERVCGRLIGSHAVVTDASGERSFFYWRQVSPARELFADSTTAPLHEIASCDALYVTGITLAVLRAQGRERLLALMQDARREGRPVYFNLNFRASLWEGFDEARIWNARCLQACSVALSSVDDITGVFECRDSDAQLGTVEAFGAGEIVLTAGGNPVRYSVGGVRGAVEIRPAARVIDTTAAGDAFNAGYIAARVRGESCRSAILNGHDIALAVLGHPGAITPRADTSR